MKWWTRIKGPKQVEVYRDDADRWRWRAVARNGQVVDAAEQGYSTKYYAMAKAERYATPRGITPVYAED